jgi:DUF177 domain-containing protein
MAGRYFLEGRSIPGLVIDISDLSSTPGAAKEIRRREPIAGVKVPLTWMGDEEAAEISLLAESVIEGILVSGEVAGVLHQSCSRCLRDFDDRFTHEVEETFFYSHPEENYHVENERIDLEPMLRDVILLAVPVAPLHSADCLGLCPVCGQDRNEVDCGHTQDTSDLRWAPLKELVLEQPQSGQRAARRGRE